VRWWGGEVSRAALRLRLALFAALLVSVGCTHEQPSRDVLTVLTQSEPVHLDPRFPEDALGAALGRLVYRGLMEGDPRTFLARPAMAERIERVDATHVRAVLRAGLMFQDGSNVTARDVAATYRALLDPARGSRLRSTYARVIRRVVLVDERTVEFELHRPDGSFESLLQQPVLPARDANGAELTPIAGAESRFVGSGILRVARFSRGRWEFTRVIAGREAPSRINILSLHDPNTLAQRMLHGRGDVAEIKPELFDLFEHRGDFDVESAPSAGFTFLGVRCTSPGLSDRRVRAAIAHAVDRERLRQGKLGSRAVASTGPVPPSHWAYEHEVAHYRFDQARARALLDEAGLVDPPGPTPRARWVLRVSSQRFAMTVAQALASMLADVGIEVVVRPSELATLLSDLRQGSFDLTFLTVPDLSDPWGLSFWFGSASIPTSANPGAGGNRWRFRSEALDAALDAGARSIGTENRAPHYRQAQRILADELPVIPLWHADVVFVASRRYQNLTPRGDGQLDFLLGLTRRQGMW
jgi:peptide/nickel transport system substrate-binding protein